MRRWAAFSTMSVVMIVGFALVVPVGQAADAAKELAAKYILATAKAAGPCMSKGLWLT
ncbi:MAG: hypothetical protein KC643_26145 [Nitrospira sp.]|nr:hypothetical protein [Nitrospira sp.]